MLNPIWTDWEEISSLHVVQDFIELSLLFYNSLLLFMIVCLSVIKHPGTGRASRIDSYGLTLDATVFSVPLGGT